MNNPPAPAPVPLPYGNGDDHLSKLYAEHTADDDVLRDIHEDFARFSRRIEDLPSAHPIGMHRERALRELLSVRTEVIAAVTLMRAERAP
jgi:hypothetical protein